MDAIVTGRRTRRPIGTAALLLLSIVAALGAVWLFQAAGYPPCELCLKERLPYYAATGVAALALVFAWRGPPRAARTCFAILVLLFLFSAGFGAYHAGVEWGWWPGPSGCTGAPGERAATSADFLHQLQTVQVVRCDAVAIRILGLSLAGWNAVGSLAIAALAALGTRRV